MMKLVNVGTPNSWRHFKGVALIAFNEVCWKKRGRRKEILGGGKKR